MIQFFSGNRKKKLLIKNSNNSKQNLYISSILISLFQIQLLYFIFYLTTFLFSSFHLFYLGGNSFKKMSKELDQPPPYEDAPSAPNLPDLASNSSQSQQQQQQYYPPQYPPQQQQQQYPPQQQQYSQQPPPQYPNQYPPQYPGQYVQQQPVQYVQQPVYVQQQSTTPYGFVLTQGQPTTTTTIVTGPRYRAGSTGIPLIFFFVGFCLPILWVFGSVWACLPKIPHEDRVWGIVNLVFTIFMIIGVIIFCSIFF